MTERNPSNVVFVVLDTVRKDHLSAYGYERDTTPYLEEFADDAAVYDNAVAPAPWTLPVHASLFTGMYPSEHGATQENPYLQGVDTLAENLSEAGYSTACYSSNAWITPYTNLTDGFDDQDNFFEILPSNLLSGPLGRFWRAVNDYETLRKASDWIMRAGGRIHDLLASGESADTKTPKVIDSSIDFIDAADDYFLFINLMDAHLPYYPPEEEREEFAPGVDPDEVCQSSKAYNAGKTDIDEEEWSEIRSLYDAEIKHMDSELERLFEWMKANDEWKDTMVVVCADHGEHHGEHSLYGHEFSVYDELVNVPLMIKHPEIEDGTRSEQVELVDLYHTVLDHAGVKADGSTQPFDETRSLLSEKYRDFEDSEYAFVEYHRPIIEIKQFEDRAKEAGNEIDENSRFYSRMRSARTRDKKYIMYEKIDDEFYSLDGTEAGSGSIITESGDEKREFLNALGRFEGRVGGVWDADVKSDEEVLDGIGDEAKDRLEELGYID